MMGVDQTDPGLSGMGGDALPKDAKKNDMRHAHDPCEVIGMEHKHPFLGVCSQNPVQAVVVLFLVINLCGVSILMSLL